MSATGALLAHDRIDRYRSFGAFGKPAYQSHVQLRAMLASKRGPRFANYFAKPTYDPDSGELRWTAELPGAARGWRQMSPEEQATHALELEVVRSGLLSFVQELRAQGGGQPGGAAAFASLLEQAMKVPAQGDFLYFVGDQPVIAFWGFENPNGASVDPASLPPQLAAPAPAEPVPSAAAPAAPAAVATRRRAWWWWLWLLLALLLLGLLAWLLPRACTTPPAGALDTEGRKAEKPLEIPPGALERGDLSFLEGTWQLGEERLRAYQGRPDNVVGSDRLVLRFGKDGSGSNHAVERLRQGRRVADCSGGLQARTDGRKLYFERHDCNVPGQPSLGLNGSKHECLVEKDGRTMCYGINNDGVRWEAPLRRLQ